MKGADMWGVEIGGKFGYLDSTSTFMPFIATTSLLVFLQVSSRILSLASVVWVCLRVSLFFELFEECFVH